MNKPYPGSKEAEEQGCKCPVLDNEYGKGIDGNGEENGWFVVATCPLHGRAIRDAINAKDWKG